MATQEERRAATSAALRKAGRQLFARKGFDAVSVDEIAALAGVTRGAFYHHFVGKEVLFESIFEDMEGELAASVAAASGRDEDARQRLLRGCLAFIDEASSSRYRRVVLIDGPVVLGWSRYREIDAHHFLGLLVGALADLHPRGDPGETKLLARALLASVCELAATAASRPRERSAMDRVVGRLVDAL